jgi:hypothetical protein
MTEIELEEEGFEIVNVRKEDSGDKSDYYYYSLKLNDHVTLTSSADDESTRNTWKVFCYEIDLAIDNLEDLQCLISLFSKSSKIS